MVSKSFNFCTITLLGVFLILGCGEERAKIPVDSLNQSSQLSREAEKETRQFEDGSTYEGELALGVPNGFGTKTF